MRKLAYPIAFALILLADLFGHTTFSYWCEVKAMVLSDWIRGGADA